jgi:hypothetical protein
MPRKRGRPLGSKGVKVTREKILASRQHSWDKWETSTGALARARAMLLECMEDTDARWADRIICAKEILNRGLPIPLAAPEPQPQQVLNIIRLAAQLNEPVIEAESYAVREAVPNLDEVGEAGESTA